MGWDDHDIQDWDDYEYVNKLGIYEEDEQEDDPEDDLYLAGLDPDELENLDEDELREALEDAGMDPDDYDDLGYTGSTGRTHPAGTSRTTTNYVRKPYQNARQTYNPNSASDNFLVAFGAGGIAAVCGLLGGSLLKHGLDLGIVLIIAAVVFGIITLVYVVKWISRL